MATDSNQDSNMDTKTREKITFVMGGGPVGAMQAIFLAQRGFEVELYESKKDIREVKLGRGRSINLALSHRGRESLRAIGCEEDIVSKAIPMYSRYIHLSNGKISIQPYGTKGEAILSVDRQELNEFLLTKAEQYPNIKLHFEHKLVRSDINTNTHTFSTPDQENVVATNDFTFGCDGAYSTVRRQLMRWSRFDYSQSYIEHGYKELRMPPTSDNEFAMPSNHLHIWPRNEFMMIALPNTDKSFTLTLFMPFAVFDIIKTKENLLEFFEKYFPDSIEKIGLDNLVSDFFSNPLGPLISVKCYPYYLNSRVVLMGDAAHAVVPFYGQGLNTGMEDCLIFDECLDKYTLNLHSAAQKYSDIRWKDGHGIADLSMYNYLEMRSHVTSRLFLFRKYLDNFLHSVFPKTFVPLYTMVAFTRIPIHKVIERNEWQRRVITRGIRFSAVTGFLGLLTCAGYLFYRSAGLLFKLKLAYYVFR